jgi:glycosyltransferase involved in cell wall biosynthesis
MKRLLFVCDPLGGSMCVQLELLLSLGKSLREQYSLSVFTPHCSPDSAELLRAANIEFLVPSRSTFGMNFILRKFEQSNESMLWAESWMREILLRSNQRAAEEALDGRRFDRVLNMSSTVIYPCDLWWIQGTPLELTIAGMASTNLAARMADMLARPVVAWLDGRFVREMKRVSRQIVANSPFLMELFRARQVPVSGVIYSAKDFAQFRPPDSKPSRDYVLTYVGKETERIDFHALREAGVPVVGFGGKIPAAARMRGITDCIDFRGFVPDHELVDLYSNAMFTLFPFSMEPFGYVPIESMACGTPVLTFDRQGPGDTVVNGRTGWLVHTCDEMVRKATELWSRGSTGISPEECVRRAKDFSVHRSVNELTNRIERLSPG